jgi:hypothetical protein
MMRLNRRSEMRDHNDIERQHIELSDDQLETVAVGMLTLGTGKPTVVAAVSDMLENVSQGAITALASGL